MRPRIDVLNVLLKKAVDREVIDRMPCDDAIAWRRRRRRRKGNGWNNLTGGEAGIRILKTRLSKWLMARDFWV